LALDALDFLGIDTGVDADSDCLDSDDKAVANDFVEDTDVLEFDFVDIGTNGDDAILILLVVDGMDDATIEGVVDTVLDDFTFGVDAGVDADVATGVGILLRLIELELLIFGMDGISEEFEFEVFILLNSGLSLALALALVLVDGGPETSDKDDMLKFSGTLGEAGTSGEGDGAGVAL
jgi:hypothetical protein